MHIYSYLYAISIGCEIYRALFYSISDKRFKSFAAKAQLSVQKRHEKEELRLQAGSQSMYNKARYTLDAYDNIYILHVALL